jgi:hypothetical protein
VSQYQRVFSYGAVVPASICRQTLYFEVVLFCVSFGLRAEQFVSLAGGDVANAAAVAGVAGTGRAGLGQSQVRLRIMMSLLYLVGYFLLLPLA